MAQGSETPPEPKVLFCDALRATLNVSESAKLAGVSRPAVYVWRDADPLFAAMWDRAMDAGRRMAADDIEATAHRLARDGSEEYMTSGKGLVLDPATGLPLMQRRFTPAHSVRMLESLRPEVYGRREAGQAVRPAELMPDPAPTPDEPAPENIVE